ncbi:unnamed protein product [Medioppia subpectinata]|uniref:Kazal-like domain-containing protein n=1 Tax=Medioppia subpectinata TaxID=1979941 RepID=A0A7R9Q9U5_9ACAR|nr:unnamed protein product [Medioppia subpectinata]CAG2116807.1 unnamed protein product [Medioppia subpectinata]
MASLIVHRCPHPIFTQTAIINSNLELTAQCNNKCGCTTSAFQPVCADDHKSNYFSPCYAGCSQYDPQKSTFGECSCVGGNSPIVTTGYCDNNCNKFPIYIALLGIAGVIQSTSKIGDTLITLSINPISIGVRDDHRHGVYCVELVL